MTIRGAMTYNRYRVRRNTTEPGFSFEARNDQVSQTLLIPGLDRLNPNKLFTQGQPGGWADPYDLTLMWIDDAGTTPATIASLGTGIGRVITKGNAITLTQANAADRPVWGRHPVSGIVNLLTNSQALTSAGWSTLNATVTANGDMFKIVGNVGETSTELRQTYTTAELGATITISCFAREDDARYMHLGRAGAGTWFDLRTGTVLSNLAGFTGVVGPVEPDGSRRYSTSATETIANGTATQLRIYTSVNAPSSTLPTSGGGNDGTRGILINRVQRQVGALATYQTVTNRFDITEVGSPSLYYFSGNGVNQRWRSAANLNLSGVNVLTVWAGVRTNQGTTRAAIYSQITDSDNYSQLEAPGFNVNEYQFNVRTGQAATIAGVSYTAPTTDALVGVHNRNARQLWRNGVLVNTGTGDSGINNLPNAPLDIFYRAATPDRFFNGNMYSYIIAGGAYDTRTIQRFSDWTLKPRRLITA